MVLTTLRSCVTVTGPLVVAAILSATATSRPGPARVSGTIVSDVTWEGKVLVTADVTFAEGATLTIGPGAEVTFAAGAGLFVEGRLLAEGSEKAPITFHPDSEVRPGAWAGITVRATSARRGHPPAAGTRMVRCRVTGAVHGITLARAARPPHQLSACTVSSCAGAGI